MASVAPRAYSDKQPGELSADRLATSGGFVTSIESAESVGGAVPQRAQGMLFDDDLPDLDTATGYRGPTACRAAGITYRQLDYWARTGLVAPSIRSAAGSGSQHSGRASMHSSLNHRGTYGATVMSTSPPWLR